MTKSMLFSFACLASSVGFLSAAHAKSPIEVTYKVPVPVELEKFASFEMDPSDASYSGGQTRLNFKLPLALTGRPMTFAMNKKEDGTWVGDNVDGDCGSEGELVTCNVRFKGLEIDAAAVRSAIGTQFPNPTEAFNRLRVAERFSTEPIGVLIYRMHKTEGSSSNNHDSVDEVEASYRGKGAPDTVR